MEYQTFVEEVEKLDFIPNADTADAAVKASLGIMASSLDEPHARKLTEHLPEPLTYARLRGHQQRQQIVPSVNEYIAEISQQFHLNTEQAGTLVSRVMHLTKDALDPQTEQELESNLPADWASRLRSA